MDDMIPLFWLIMVGQFKGTNYENHGSDKIDKITGKQLC